MINAAYIHEYAPHDQFMFESHYILLDVKDAEQRILALETEIQDKLYFGESVDGEMLILESEKKNIFERIGEAIISLFRSFYDAVMDIGKNIKDTITGIRKKGSTEKMKDMMNNDPEMAQKFLNAVMSGNIKAHDLKDLDELVDEATKISNQLLEGKIDKKNYLKSIENFIEKFGSTAKNIGYVIGLGSGFIKLYSDIRGVGDANIERNRSAARNFRDQTDWVDRQTERHIGAQSGSLRINNNELQNRIAQGTTESVSVNVFESVGSSFSDVINKITSFCANQLKFFDSAKKKMDSLKETVTTKLKSLKEGEDTSIFETVLAGIRKIMGVLTKELNTVKSVSDKVDDKLEDAAE